MSKWEVVKETLPVFRVVSDDEEAVYYEGGSSIKAVIVKNTLNQRERDLNDYDMDEVLDRAKHMHNEYSAGLNRVHWVQESDRIRQVYIDAARWRLRGNR